MGNENNIDGKEWKGAKPVVWLWVFCKITGTFRHEAELARSLCSPVALSFHCCITSTGIGFGIILLAALCCCVLLHEGTVSAWLYRR